MGERVLMPGHSREKCEEDQKELRAQKTLEGADKDGEG
jgi:hypothetical protein